MQMIAIRLREENLNAMLDLGLIDKALLLEKIKKFGPDGIYGRGLGRKYYYIPFGTLPYAPDSWQFCAHHAFIEKYDADMTKIDTEFVDITRK